jgi:hypothetical protein
MLRTFSGLSAVLVSVLCSTVLASGSMAEGAQVPSRADAVASGARWGTAEAVPGLAALNAGGSAQTSAVSCPSAGNCAAVGWYDSAALPFIVSEKNGTWGKAFVPAGLKSFYTGGNAGLDTVSCGAAGDCVAGGSYAPLQGSGGAFAVSEVNGTWRRAKAIPCPPPLSGGGAGIAVVSCRAAKSCTAAADFNGQPYDIGYTNGSWAPAQAITGPILTGSLPSISALSCAGSGACTLIGGGAEPSGGTWSAGITNNTPATPVLMPGDPAISALSCWSATACGAGGYTYSSSASADEALVADGAGVTWGAPQQVPGIAALTKGNAVVNAVSCAPKAGCSAAGSYTDAKGNEQAFVTSG